MLCVLFGLRCWSNIGREYNVPGAQELSIGEGCNTKGIITHELMHALGFWHEQSRTDRDDYIAVLWENIKKGSKCINNNTTLVRDGWWEVSFLATCCFSIVRLWCCYRVCFLIFGEPYQFLLVSTHILWNPFIDALLDKATIYLTERFYGIYFGFSQQ